MTNETNPKKIKKSQKSASVIGLLIIFITLPLSIWLMSKHSMNEKSEKNVKPQFANAIDHVDAETYLLENTQKQIKESEKKTAEIEQKVNTLYNVNKGAEEQQKMMEALLNLVSFLEKELAAQKTPPVTDGSLNTGVMERQFAPEGMNGASIREDKLELSDTPEILAKKVPLKNPDTFVPAGTFAKAVMIGGADASAAVNSQSNPVPMLFHLVANGTLPNQRESHLKDCVVTAAVVGDISSERGLIRLENLSCTFPNNEVVDQAVEGTIFGPEGKNGVRGVPLWRESALLQRAFAAGALSGISDSISQTYTTNSISAEGNVQSINPSKVFQVGAANGAGKAMDKLADYNIQRAEQYHPVIQLSAGTVVDVVFLKGFYLDGKKHDEKENEKKHSAQVVHGPMLFPGIKNDEAKTLPLTEAQVKRIQENSKELGLIVTNLPTTS